MAIGKPGEISPETIVHRVGGAGINNLRLSTLDAALTPPGISVLLGGTAKHAAQQMRTAFPRSRKWIGSASTVGTSTAAAVRAVGFNIVPDPTIRFPNHARLIHAQGAAAFTDQNLAELAKAFRDTYGL